MSPPLARLIPQRMHTQRQHKSMILLYNYFYKPSTTLIQQSLNLAFYFKRVILIDFLRLTSAAGKSCNMLPLASSIVCGLYKNKHCSLLALLCATNHRISKPNLSVMKKSPPRLTFLILKHNYLCVERHRSR